MRSAKRWRTSTTKETNSFVSNTRSIRPSASGNSIRKKVGRLLTRCFSVVSFAGTHLDSMILDFHRRAILQTLKSYRRLKISFLASRLKVKPELLETIIVQLILDGEIAGKIDQVNGVLDLTQRTGGAAKKYAAINQWTNTIKHLTQSTAQAQPIMAF